MPNEIATADQLTALREQAETIRTKAEIAELQRFIAAEDLCHRVVQEAEQWGDLVNRREYLYDTPGFGVSGGYDYRISTPNDRSRGKCTPFFETEQDLSIIRGIGRYLAGSLEVGVGAIESLVSFTVGTGFTYEAAPKDKANPEEQLVKEVQLCIDEIDEANNWIGDLEVESFVRSHRDGECFLWVQNCGGVPHIRIIEPDYVTEPAQAGTLEDHYGLPSLEWSFGVATDHGCPERRHGYFVQWAGNKGDWDFVPANEMVHVRLNVDRNVKRGISDFYPVQLRLERASKLLDNTLQGAAIQASIAYIREHAAGTTGTSIEAFRNSKADYSVNYPRPGGGTKTVKQERFFPGRVVDTAGTKYHAGPLGQSNAPIYVDVFQAALRIIGSRWQMPEYMISGDASNANYSSTLVSGGPFDKATQRRQAFHKRHFADLYWKALAIYCRRGRFANHGVLSIPELKRRVALKIEAPAVAIQDKVQEETIRETRHRNGVLSKRTWAGQVDLDYDAELANQAKEPQAVSPLVRAMESCRTLTEAKARLREVYP